MLLASWPAANDIRSLLISINEVTQRLPGLLTVRFFRDAGEGLKPSDSLYLIATFDHWIEIASLHALRRPVGVGSSLFNLYVPYRR